MEWVKLSCVETCRENPEYSRIYTGTECAELLADVYTRRYVYGQNMRITYAANYGSGPSRLPASVRYDNGMLYRYAWSSVELRRLEMEAAAGARELEVLHTLRSVERVAGLPEGRDVWRLRGASGTSCMWDAGRREFVG